MHTSSIAARSWTAISRLPREYFKATPLLKSASCRRRVGSGSFFRPITTELAESSAVCRASWMVSNVRERHCRGIEILRSVGTGEEAMPNAWPRKERVGAVSTPDWGLDRLSRPLWPFNDPEVCSFRGSWINSWDASIVLKSWTIKRKCECYK